MIDTDLRELRRGSMPIAVEPQVFDLLTYLVQNCDRVVSKDDLFASVWSGRIVVRGAPATRKFSVFYFREGRLIAVDSINRAPDHIAARKLLDAGRWPSFAQAGDEAFGLAGLLK